MMMAYGDTHPGLRRSNNEDSFLCQPERGVFAVADGLGGLQYGEVASGMLVELIKAASLDDLADLQSFVRSASAKICRKGLELCSSTIGTTLTLAIVADGYLRIAQVGDSVAFMTFPGGGLQLTREQTVAEERRHSGEIEVERYLEHVLTQCMGQSADVVPDVFTRDFPPSARLLLCSDGITKTVDRGGILDVLRNGESPESVVADLIAMANRAGGPDNSTAVVFFG